MHPYARRRSIVQHVQDRGLVSLHDLSALVGASEATIRRDLRDLDRQGLVRRQRGGASRPDPARRTSPGPTLAALVVDGPARTVSAVARLAAGLVEPGDAVAIGAGTGDRQLASALAQVPGLTVVTNSLVVAVELAPTDADVIVTGGSAEGGDGLALVGTAAEASLQGIRVRYAFVPADGLTAAHGLTSRSLPVASVNRALALAAQHTVALAVGAAVGRDSVVEAVPSRSIGHVVTDAHPDDGALAGLAAGGAVVHAVEDDTAAALDEEPALPVRRAG
ncbi:DeoR/GlpR family DNA-binding transcription regulator [Luteimicrobium sp. DT211]|uniref:DeoR/GlpR family DNA-binding transcription regulator n=1 Tax=Luteimicrobium sp. DT211 TaxID=3393412 RepID=UPI003CE6CB9D